MRARCQAEQAAGFTLLELLAALVVLGFLLLGLSQGLRLGAQTYDRQSRMVEASSVLDASQRALRRLIEQMDPDSPGLAKIEGSARALSFGTELPDAAAALPTRTVRALLRVDVSHRLVLRWSPVRHAELLEPASAPVDTVLLDGVDHIEIGYQLPGSRGSAWVDTWDSATPPQLVRIGIVFLRKDARQWPDLVAAPMRDRAQP